MKLFLDIDDFVGNNKDFSATIGNFDGIHLGHQKIFSDLHKKSRELNQKNLVITFNPHTKLFNHQQNNFLLTSLREKINLIEKTGLIDNLLVIEFNEDFKNVEANDFIQKILIEKLNVNYLVIGENFYFGKDKSGTIDLLKQKFGYNLQTVEILKQNDTNCSSTLIRNYIQNGDVEMAKKMLGYNYYIEDFVIEGNKLARQLGFPTANMRNSEKILPKFGVYETIATMENGKSFKAISNIGMKPTIGLTKEPLLETHILNFNDNLYGQKLKIEFLRFIREERKFNGLNELIKQIKKDVECVISN